MIPIKYWGISAWLLLACTALNAFSFVTTFSFLSLIFGIICGIGFIMNVSK